MENQNVDLYYSNTKKSSGMWNIKCEATCNGTEKKIFNVQCTDSQFIDKLTEMRIDNCSWNDIQDEYDEKFYSEIEEQLFEWLTELLEKNINN